MVESVFAKAMRGRTLLTLIKTLPKKPLSSSMQLLRVVTNQIYNEHAQVMTVPWRETGTLRITDKGERLLTVYALPNITFRIIDDGEKLPDEIDW